MQIAGKPRLPMPNVMSVYGFVGCVIWNFSASLSRGVSATPRQLPLENVEVRHPDFVGVPRDLALGHPERRNLDFVLRPFVGIAALLALRAAHHETARRGSAASRSSRPCARPAPCTASSPPRSSPPTRESRSAPDDRRPSPRRGRRPEKRLERTRCKSCREPCEFTQLIVPYSVMTTLYSDHTLTRRPAIPSSVRTPDDPAVSRFRSWRTNLHPWPGAAFRQLAAAHEPWLGRARQLPGSARSPKSDVVARESGSR